MKGSQLFFDGMVDGDGSPLRERTDVNGVATIAVSSSDFGSSSPSGSPLSANCIEHRVSRFDTLAGIAIKYGVEVVDIKRMNGLVSDVQMFAFKTLQIPLNGRHAPSPSPSNGSIDNRECTPPRRPRSDVLDLLESLNMKPSARNVSPATTSFHGYGLPPVRSSPVLGGSEMAVYKTARHTLDNGLLHTSGPLPNKHRKSRSLMNGISTEDGKDDDEKSFVEAADNEKYFRRRHLSDAGFDIPEKLLKEESSSGFSLSAGKGLVPRQKVGSRTDMDSITNGDSYEGFLSVRKSSSTPCLQEPENNSSIWLTSMWALKADILSRQMFDGLPNPIAVWRNKAARD